MGGTGSGARRSTRTADVEDALALDIRALRRLGVIKIGECIITTVSWSSGSVSGIAAKIRADLSDLSRSGVITVSAVLGQFIEQHIGVEAVASGFGGRRCYLICPITGRRCEVLYGIHGRFASRAAHRLSYATQNMTEGNRVRIKARRLRKRLKGGGCTPRPRGRNRIELAERVRDTERRAKEIYLEGLRDQGRFLPLEP